MNSSTDHAIDRSARRRLRTLVAVAAGVVALTAAACAPGPGPATGPTWHATRLARTVTPAGITNHLGAWTDGAWFATVRLTSVTGGGTSGELLVFPRTGPGDGTLGTPQVLPLDAGSGGGLVGEHMIGLAVPNGVRIYRETAGTWAQAGAVTFPTDFVVSDLTDDWVVARRPPGAPEGGDGAVILYRLDRSGPTVEVTSVVTLHPDATWSPGLRDGFGANAVIDGALLAVTATPGISGGGPLVRVYRNVLDDWHPVQTIGDTVAIQRQTATMAVEDGPTIDRLVLSPFITSLQPPAVDVWADTGSGFTIEQHIELDPGLTDASGGNLFGSSVAIDGDLLAVTSRSELVDSSTPGHAPVTVGHVQLYRHGSIWAPEHDASLFTVPADPATRQSLPFRLQIGSGHVAVHELITPDEPPGCSFPCFTIGMGAWSLDRY